MTVEKEVKSTMSQRFTLNKEDIIRWGKNTLIFLAPALIIFLTAIKSGADVKDALFLVYLWGLNVAIDLLRKFVAGGEVTK